MKKLFFIPLLLLVTLNFKMKGQSSLGVDTSSYVIPGNVYFNQSYTFKVYIINYGPQNYNGLLRVYYALDTSSTLIPKIDTLLSTTNGGVSIPFNSLLGDSATISIDSVNFRSGINTVVIWPKYSTYTTHDSLKVQILVLGYLGIENHSSQKPLIFPNPMQGRLFIANKDPNFIIEQVRILDISGRLVFSERFNGSIDVNKLASGSYTLELFDKTGKASRYKVIKE